MGKVFTVSPAFRAENSQTRRHLAEFTMLEAEEYLLDSLDALMDRVEHLTKSLAAHVADKCAADIELLGKVNKYADGHRLLSAKYIRLRYHEAIALINQRQQLSPIVDGHDISRYHEQVLLDYFEQIPIFISHWPSALKPFYMKRDTTSDLALNFDLLAPIGGEICGGSLREDDYDTLRCRLEQMQRVESLGWYLELRQVGNAPHGGYGMGIERLLQSMTGLENVKDAIAYPRWVRHCPL